MSNIGSEYFDLFFPQQQPVGRKLKDNYKLRLYMSLLPESRGRSPTEIAHSFSQNIKEYSLLKERNLVARFCKELQQQGFLSVVEREQEIKKKGARLKYYAVNRDKFLRVSTNIKPGFYSQERGLNVFIRILEKNKLYYDPRLTSIQDYFLITLCFFYTDNPNVNAQAQNKVIEQFVHWLKILSPIGSNLEFTFNKITKGITKDKHDLTKVEKFNPVDSVNFIYFFVDVILTLYESISSLTDFEDIFNDEQKENIRMIRVLFQNVTKQLVKVGPKGFKWKVSTR